VFASVIVFVIERLKTVKQICSQILVPISSKTTLYELHSTYTSFIITPYYIASSSVIFPLMKRFAVVD